MTRAMNQGLAPLKSSEYDKLLRRWGFEPIDHGGNHPMYLAPNGITKFPISSAGKVTQRELRQAAKIVGVSRRAFLAGPPKTRPIRTVQVDPDELIRKAQAEMDELAVIAEQRAKEKQMAKVIEEKPKMGRPPGSGDQMIRQLFLDNPTEQLAFTRIVEQTGLSTGSVSGVLFRLKKEGFLRQDEKYGPYLLERRKQQLRQSERRRASDMKRAPESGPRNGNLRNEILRLLEENEGRPLSIDLVVEKLGTVRSSTANALLSLSRIGAIDQLGRGIYQFKMPQQNGSSVATIGHGDVSVVRGPASEGGSDGQAEGVLLEHVSSAGVQVPGVPAIGPEPGGRDRSGSGDVRHLREAGLEAAAWAGSRDPAEQGRAVGAGERAARPSQLQSPEREHGGRGEGFGPRDEAPIGLIPAGPSLWEEMKDLGDGRFLLRDENGELWVAKMQRLDV